MVSLIHSSLHKGEGNALEGKSKAPSRIMHGVLNTQTNLTEEEVYFMEFQSRKGLAKAFFKIEAM